MKKFLLGSLMTGFLTIPIAIVACSSSEPNGADGGSAVDGGADGTAAPGDSGVAPDGAACSVKGARCAAGPACCKGFCAAPFSTSGQLQVDASEFVCSN